jgi:hypothetical protein
MFCPQINVLSRTIFSILYSNEHFIKVLYLLIETKVLSLVLDLNSNSNVLDTALVFETPFLFFPLDKEFKILASSDLARIFYD